MGAIKPLYGTSKFWEMEKEKALAKINELNEKVKICDEEISKIKNQTKN